MGEKLTRFASTISDSMQQDVIKDELQNAALLSLWAHKNRSE